MFHAAGFILRYSLVWFLFGCGYNDVYQGLSKQKEMSFNPVTKVLQSNEGTTTRTTTNVSNDRYYYVDL